jgi:hypothetical protein
MDALKNELLELDTGELDMLLTGFDAKALEKLMTQVHVPDLIDPVFSSDDKKKITVTCFERDKDEIKTMIIEATKGRDGVAVYE